jgi:hypothetical protein
MKRGLKKKRDVKRADKKFNKLWYVFLALIIILALLAIGLAFFAMNKITGDATTSNKNWASPLTPIARNCYDYDNTMGDDGNQQSYYNASYIKGKGLFGIITYTSYDKKVCPRSLSPVGDNQCFLSEAYCTTKGKGAYKNYLVCDDDLYVSSKVGPKQKTAWACKKIVGQGQCDSTCVNCGEINSCGTICQIGNCATAGYICESGKCVPPPLPDSCTDSDDGLDVVKTGVVSGIHNGVYYSKTDYCDTGYAYSVYEYYCNRTTNYFEKKNSYCSTGKCNVSLCPPPAPETVELWGGGDGLILDWTGVHGATKYSYTRIDVSPNVQLIILAPNTIVRFSGVPTGHLYRFSVAAINDAGAGPPKSIEYYLKA